MQAEMRLCTAQDLQKLGVIDRVIPEPVGGAHRDGQKSIKAVGDALAKMLAELSDHKPRKLIEDRRRKFLDMGQKGLAA